MEGSCTPESGYGEWEAKRRFIAATIDHDGSVLDVGCANGFFLRSLQEWSGYSLVPYGIDIEEPLIVQAKNLFPEYKNNFCVLDVRSIKNIGQCMPKRYDFIFWNFL